ncbi:MAG: 3-phosphoshikimate 1-carboxyvinyltransferase [Desulfovibrionaceae bacterium]|nr:3-phosphoshikimate 1-carboxyvinyltransferase [Desulfovibrionaceae bacterium]
MENRGEDHRKRTDGRSKLPRPAETRDDRGESGPEGRRKPGFERRADGRGPRPERGGKGPERRPRGRELAAVQDLDEELLRLVMRRARLLDRLRVGDRLDPDVEKTLRVSWEEKAARLTRDARLARELFRLLQAVEPLSHAEEEQLFYNLAPALKPVDIRLPAPADTDAARCWMALAASAGHGLSLARVPLTDAVVDAVKVLNQMGGQLWWEEDGTILSRGGSGLTRGMDKVLHVGDDAFNLWLVIALSLNIPSRFKITGASSLRFLDLAPLSHFLPELSARLTTVVPGQHGLPIRLECAGMVPDTVSLPAGLPPDFVAALVLAAPFRERPARFILPESGPAARPPLLDTVLTVLAEAGVTVEWNERSLTVLPGLPGLPEKPELPMHILLATTLLALPALSGGRTRLEGPWASTRAAALARRLLECAGLELHADRTGILSTRSTRQGQPAPPDAEIMRGLAAEAPALLPLAVLLTALAARSGRPAALTAVPTEEIENCEAFLARLGLLMDERGELKAREERDEAPDSAWLAPSASWAVALALGAFLRPNLRLANPGVLTGLFPGFWALYNTLPSPEFAHKKAEPPDVKPARRRIIAQGVYGELPPEPPAGDDC